MSHKEEQRKRSLALLRRKEAKAKRAAQHEANRSAKLKRKEHVKFDQDLKFPKNDESIGGEEGDDMSMKSKASKESSTGK